MELRLKNANTVANAAQIVFSVPAGGFASTPIVQMSSNDIAFLAAADNVDPQPVTFKVDKQSPYLKVRGNFVQQLVDWTRNETAYPVNTSGITLTAMPKEAGSAERMYFTPEAGETKSGVAVQCCGQSGMTITVR